MGVFKWTLGGGVCGGNRSRALSMQASSGHEATFPGPTLKHTFRIKYRISKYKDNILVYKVYKIIYLV